jgi:hypothetical protein
VHVRNLETNLAVATQNVVTLPSGSLEHATSRLAIYGDQLLVAVSRQSPTNASPEGVYTMTFNPLTGALGAATLADAGDYSGVVPVGRRIYVSRDTHSLRVVRMPTPAFDPTNVSVVGTAAPSLGWTTLGTPAIAGELLVIPGNTNGFQVARISFDTTVSTYPAMEPRVYLRLARSSATNAHVMADRIYLSAYERSLEIFEIR